MANKLNVQIVPLAEVPMIDEVDLSPKHRPTIMVVDDEKVIADTLSMILSKSGFDTVTAYDGATALQMAQELAPDLVISDVVMPEMTGIDLAIAITETIPNCKILLFSGQAATVDLLEKARRSGHNFTTLTKPIHPTDMLRRIAESLTTKSAFESRSSSSRDSLHQFLPV